jgi:hypothetical protein
MPYVSTTPMGVVDTVECIQQIQKHVNKLTFFFWIEHLIMNLISINKLSLFLKLLGSQDLLIVKI